MEQKNENHGGNPVNVGQLIGNIYNTSQPEQQRDATQQKLLDAVQKEVRDRLDQSLHRVVNAALINLGKESQPDRVRSPWQMEMRSKARSPQLLPPETAIAEVFDSKEIDRKLLILGEPGSGKTTTMLELAQGLVERAQTSPTQPVPVLLSLSSWKPAKPTKANQSNEAQPFLNWLLGEIKLKYGLNPKLSQKWLAKNELLLLLDGLDEVKPEHQQACAQAINHWLSADLEHQPAGLVVCCRIEEYEQVVRHCLFLNGAIALQPLTESQIADYLHQFGLASVWQSAQVSDSLQALLQKPLFLSVFGFVASEGLFDGAAWQQRTTEAAQQEYLWDQYWETAMQRELMPARDREQGLKSNTYGKKELPSRKALRRSLVFAAKGMAQDSLTELLIERIQPSWLPTKTQRWQHRLIFGLISGLIFGLISGLIFSPILGLVLGLTGGLLGGLIAELDDVRPLEKPQILMSCEARREILGSIREWLIFAMLLGLFFGLGVGLTTGLNVGLFFGLSAGLITGLIFGLILGLIGWLIGWANVGIDITTRIRPNQGIKNSWQNMLLFLGLALSLALPLRAVLETLLVRSLEPDLVKQITGSLLFVLIWGCFYKGGAEPLSKHLALRFVMWRYGYAPLRYDRILDYANERLLLQRIGGRYRFMHKLLQEHFAAMPLEEG